MHISFVSMLKRILGVVCGQPQQTGDTEKLFDFLHTSRLGSVSL